jgi:NAD(P)-dependent dehydrogenase (short-subunit alcohol dehydrogenase family)
LLDDAIDPWRLDGQVALVTGGGRGLGRSCAIELAGAGAQVVLVARTLAEVEEAARAAGSGAVPRVADVTDETQLAGVIEEASDLGELRVLVTAAGTNRPGAARDYPMSSWDSLFKLNVRATFLACRMVGDHLLRRRLRGSLVTMSSQMGSVGYPGRVAYCATKHAVDGLTRALAVEWAQANIRVNAVAPTFVLTQMTAAMLADREFREDVVERRLPTKRLVNAEDVARAVRYLASDASANVTGHILRVDGGWTAW